MARLYRNNQTEKSILPQKTGSAFRRSLFCSPLTVNRFNYSNKLRSIQAVFSCN